MASIVAMFICIELKEQERAMKDFLVFKESFYGSDLKTVHIILAHHSFDYNSVICMGG